MREACNKFTDVLMRVKRGQSSVEDLERATRDVLAEYADLRGNVVYGMGNAKTPDELKASRIGSCLVKGQFPYPFTDDGVPMVAGMVICRPDGSKAVLASVEIESPRRKENPISLFFEDGLIYNGPIRGFSVPKIDGPDWD